MEEAAIILRDYREEDRDALLELVNKLEEYVKPLDPLKRVKNLPGFTEASLHETLENVEKYQGKITFAEESGKIIGMIIGVIWEQSEKNKLEIGPHTVGEVVDLYIEEVYRGKGLGKKMLKMMEDYFISKGCDSMWIEVFTPNENAHNVYKKYGFVDREIGMLKQLSSK
jgi:ribosomal protein S18 acetylase RimI-like enzyme